MQAAMGVGQIERHSLAAVRRRSSGRRRRVCALRRWLVTGRLRRLGFAAIGRLISFLEFKRIALERLFAALAGRARACKDKGCDRGADNCELECTFHLFVPVNPISYVSSFRTSVLESGPQPGLFAKNRVYGPYPKYPFADAQFGRKNSLIVYSAVCLRSSRMPSFASAWSCAGNL